MEYKGLDAYTANVQQMFAKAGFTETPIGEYSIAEMFLYGTPLDVVFSVGSDVACGFHINDVLREQVHPFVVDKKWVGHGVCRWKDTWEKSNQPKEAANVMEDFRAAARKDGGSNGINR